MPDEIDFTRTLWTTVPTGLDPKTKKWTLSLVASPFPDPNDSKDLAGSAWENWMHNVVDPTTGQLLPGLVTQIEILDSGPPPTATTGGTNPLWKLTPVPVGGQLKMNDDPKDPRDLWNMVFPFDSKRTSQSNLLAVQAGASSGDRFRRQLAARTPTKFASLTMTHSVEKVTEFVRSSLQAAHHGSLTESALLDTNASVEGSVINQAVSAFSKTASYKDFLRRATWTRKRHNETSGIKTPTRTPSPFATALRDKIVQNLGRPSSDPYAPQAKGEARRVERNIYRLSAHPWTELDDDALAVACKKALEANPKFTPPAGLDDIYNSVQSNQPDKIHALTTSLFHGRVARRKRPDYILFAPGDITDLKAFAQLLSSSDNRQQDPVSNWIWELLTPPLQKAVSDYANPAQQNLDPKDLEAQLDTILNQQVQGSVSIFDHGFQNVVLRPQTSALQASHPTPADLERLNRMLIEDAFPSVFLLLPAFSQKIAMLNHYPELMRRLGLIFDFSMESTAMPPATSPPNWAYIRVTITKKSDVPGHSDVPAGNFPWTKLDASAFRPAVLADASNTLGKLYDHDMLLANRLCISSIEHDAQLLKITAQAQNPASQPAASASAETSPAPRSNGIAIAINNRGEAVQQQQQNAQKAPRGALPALGLESMVRGYVPHVRMKLSDSSYGAFLSLCQRAETYDFRRQLSVEPPNATYSPDCSTRSECNGYVAAPATTTQDNTSHNQPQPVSKDLHVHENIARWTGWSLVTRDPGANPAPLDKLPTDPAKPENAFPPHPGFAPQIKTTFTCLPKSLPTLRYGRTYQFQIPCMDIAGKMPQPDATIASTLTDDYLHLRYDPVPPPEVLLAEHLSSATSPGEQLTQLVVRTGNKGQITKECWRALVPPKCTFTMAKECGVTGDKSPDDLDSFAGVYLPSQGFGKFPSDYAEFLPGDIVDLSALADRLVAPIPDPASVFLQTQLNEDTKKAIGQFKKNKTKGEQTLRQLLVRDLNRVIQTSSGDTNKFLREFALRSQTLALRDQNPKEPNPDALVLARLLLEDVYNGLLARGRLNPATLRIVPKAMAWRKMAIITAVPCPPRLTRGNLVAKPPWPPRSQSFFQIHCSLQAMIFLI